MKEAPGPSLESRELTSLATLVEILEAITSSLDLHAVTKAIVTKLTSIVPAVRCSIVYIDDSKKHCYVMASHDNPDVNMLELELDRYPELRRAIQTQAPVIIQDVLTDPLMADVRSHLVGLDFRSIAVIPLTFAKDILGTLCLKTARDKEQFSDEDIKFCTAMAQASANALKNAVLHRRALDELICHRRTRNKLSSILDHSPDLILTTDTAGNITEFNRGAEKALGYSRTDVMGKPC